MFRKTAAVLSALVRKALLVGVTAGLTGTAGAFFLWSLDAVTRVRFAAPWLLWCLPVIGLLVALLYQRGGGRAAQGTGLILDEVHEPGGGVPARMAPLVLLGTLATHLGGGSAGREGTAVQMGGSLAAAVAKWGRAAGKDQAGLLMAGVAAGFGAVFGTPWAGAVFAVEVLRRWNGRWQEWPWCLAAALLADCTCHAWGAQHTVWPPLPVALTTPGGLVFWGKIAAASLVFGLLARGFVAGAHGVQSVMRHAVPWEPGRPVVGGLLVIGLVLLSGTRDYLGLGTLPVEPGGLALASFFAEGGGAPADAWAWKAAFTLVTVGSGFKGGEVTPLFFIGASAGQVLAGLLGLPAALLAALGMVAVFGAASRTPAACFLMGIELFGAVHALPMALACGVAASLNGRGLYSPAEARSGWAGGK